MRVPNLQKLEEGGGFAPPPVLNRVNRYPCNKDKPPGEDAVTAKGLPQLPVDVGDEAMSMNVTHDRDFIRQNLKHPSHRDMFNSLLSEV